MKFKASLLVSVFSLLLGSCAWWDAHGDGKPVAKGPICKEKKCRVVVTVAACKIVVNPDWLGLAKGVTDIEIVWEIEKSAGVTFAGTGAVFFKEKDREATARQFRGAQLVDDKKYRMTALNTARGEYHYGVTVVENGKQCPPLDPIIVSDM